MEASPYWKSALATSWLRLACCCWDPRCSTCGVSADSGCNKTLQSPKEGRRRPTTDAKCQASVALLRFTLVHGFRVELDRCVGARHPPDCKIQSRVLAGSGHQFRRVMMNTLDSATRSRVFSALREQQIELPSWAFGNSG